MMFLANNNLATCGFYNKKYFPDMNPFLFFRQHLAASRGHEDITLFLIHEHVDVNIKGNCQTY